MSSTVKKCCTRCNQEKELDKFSYEKNGKYNKRSYCKACRSEQYRSVRNFEPTSVIDLDGEIWRDIVGYEGHYMVSNKGRIKGVNRLATTKFKGDTYMNIPSKLLTPIKIGPYMYISMRSGRPQKTYLVHRLVALAFIDNKYNHPVINHLDCDGTNNNIENLEWTTQKENILHSVRMGRMRTGCRNNKSKAVSKFNLRGELIEDFETTAQAARTVNGSSQSVTNCCNGKTRSFRGFIWKHK